MPTMKCCQRSCFACTHRVKPNGARACATVGKALGFEIAHKLDDIGKIIGDASNGVGWEHTQRCHIKEEVMLKAARHLRCTGHAGQALLLREIITVREPTPQTTK